MAHFVIPRTGEVDLEFDGERIAHVTSQFDNAKWTDPFGVTRWTEHSVYRTDAGRYIVETLGCSDSSRDKTRREVTVCSTPLDVRMALHRKNPDTKVTYLTRLGTQALKEAAAADPNLASVSAETVR